MQGTEKPQERQAYPKEIASNLRVNSKERVNNGANPFKKEFCWSLHRAFSREGVQETYRYFSGRELQIRLVFIVQVGV